MKCIYCNKSCIKKGVRQNAQKYYCKSCSRYQQSAYLKKRCDIITDKLVVQLNNESMGVSSISKILDISKSTVVRIIKRLAGQIKDPEFSEENQRYEVDEMYTYVKNKEKECWIMYAMNKRTKAIMSLIVGSRTKENLSAITDKLKGLNPSKIYTDKLPVYRSLVNTKVHEVKKYKTNHIERHNLTLRTHLKRLSRKTICFSKSIEMLENCLRIYLWGEN